MTFTPGDLLIRGCCAQGRGCDRGGCGRGGIAVVAVGAVGVLGCLGRGKGQRAVCV